jgi:hypothetical protein
VTSFAARRDICRAGPLNVVNALPRASRGIDLELSINKMFANAIYAIAGRAAIDYSPLDGYCRVVNGSDSSF